MAAADDNVFANDSSYHWEMRRKASFSKLTGAVPRTIPGMYNEEEDPHADVKKEKLWKLMETYLSSDIHSIQRSVVNHVPLIETSSNLREADEKRLIIYLRSAVKQEYTCAKTRFNCDPEACYRAAAFSVRDRLIETLNDTNSFFHEKDCKRGYYLSLEFLLGRAFQNALVNLDIEANYTKALAELGFNLQQLYEYEHDPALGNGGLGRLAACFLDSMATVNLPCWGYGIRYTYGIFEQKIINGRQVEHPDYWLTMSNPWEIERPDCTYAVRFYGAVKEYRDPQSGGRLRSKWVDGEIVQAMAYDNPIPGFDTYNTINLRLWKACPSKEFDFHLFNVGRYLEAVRDRQRAESISAVLYPNDNTLEGKELRLKQQYFFVCATVQDVLRRFKKGRNRDWKELPEKLQMQLNDTHPTIAIPEMMRILLDIENLEWELAWDLTKQIFNYTNHTVLPEALEKWSADLVGRLLPRHLLIINEINFHFLNEVRGVCGDDWKIGRMSIYEEGEEKRIRMGHLAVIGSAHVNGVAAIHSELVKKYLFPEFVEFYESRGRKDKFLNVTNGVTPRRWIYCANRGLADLFSNWLGSDSWLKELDMLVGLQNHIDDPQLRKEWRAVKRSSKQRLAAWVEQRCQVKLDVDGMLFDVQVKRIHEYKRQLLNCLYTLHRYLAIKKMAPQDKKNVLPRATMIGGKAAPGYYIAKHIIKLVNNLAQVVNNDPDVNAYLKVVFLPNYNVSNAQVIIPASDLSQHISTAGTEASGTSNMKFVMNGGLILGTLDGANIEIREECGDDTMFIFGAKEHEVAKIREQARNGNYPIDGRLREVFDFIRSGKLACGDGQAHSDFVALVEQLCSNGYGRNGDYYLLLHDFSDYCRAQALVDETYKDQEKWTTLSIKAASSMGKFSTDRSIREYAKYIWHIDACERPPPDEFQRMRSFANDTVSAGGMDRARGEGLSTNSVANNAGAAGAANNLKGGKVGPAKRTA